MPYSFILLYSVIAILRQSQILIFQGQFHVFANQLKREPNGNNH